jgi:hypothetical protein
LKEIILNSISNILSEILLINLAIKQQSISVRSQPGLIYFWHGLGALLIGSRKEFFGFWVNPG